MTWGEGLQPREEGVSAPLDFGAYDAFAALTAELEQTRGERDAAYAERDNANAELEETRTELDATRVERDEFKAQRDQDPALPGILNKRAWIERSVGHLATGRPVGIFLIDIDNFGLTNKQLGVLAGDQMLEDISGRLSRRRGDLIGRWGGDEFVTASFLDDDETDVVDLNHRTLDPPRAMYRRYLHLLTASSEFVQAQNATGEATWLGVSIGGAATLGVKPTENPMAVLRILLKRSDINMRSNKIDQVPEITSERDFALTSALNVLARADIPPEMFLKYLKAQEARKQKPSQSQQALQQPLRPAA